MEMVINYSGGKDSSAMLAYLSEKYPRIHKHVVMADTGWEHIDAIAWGKSITARFNLPLHVVKNPNKDFMEMVRRRKMFPSPAQRQCTSDLKRGPIQTWIRRNVADPVVINCMGMRAEESPQRAKKPKLSRDKKMCNGRRTVWNWLPIHEWTEGEVRRFLAERNIPLHPVYRYLNRFSCRVCIYMTKDDLKAVSRNDPDAFQRISDLEAEIKFTMQPGQTIWDRVRE